MTAQDRIERDLRLFIGDLQVQILMLKAQIAEFQEDAAAAELDKQPAEPDIKQPHKTNGKHSDVAPHG